MIKLDNFHAHSDKIDFIKTDTLYEILANNINENKGLFYNI